MGRLNSVGNRAKSASTEGTEGVLTLEGVDVGCLDVRAFLMGGGDDASSEESNMLSSSSLSLPLGS